LSHTMNTRRDQKTLILSDSHGRGLKDQLFNKNNQECVKGLSRRDIEVVSMPGCNTEEMLQYLYDNYGSHDAEREHANTQAYKCIILHVGCCDIAYKDRRAPKQNQKTIVQRIDRIISRLYQWFPFATIVFSDIYPQKTPLKWINDITRYVNRQVCKHIQERYAAHEVTYVRHSQTFREGGIIQEKFYIMDGRYPGLHLSTEGKKAAAMQLAEVINDVYVCGHRR
ncbi:unnamed protein product, partial [Owenia fusiformis]